MAKRESGKLCPFEEDGKYGFVNEDGVTMVKPVFDRVVYEDRRIYVYQGITSFHIYPHYSDYGRITAYQDKRQGYLTLHGDFSEYPLRYTHGYAIFRDKDLTGVMDEDKRIIVPPLFRQLLWFPDDVDFVIDITVNSDPGNDIIFIMSLDRLNRQAMEAIADWYTRFPQAYWYYDRKKNKLVSLEIDPDGRYRYKGDAHPYEYRQPPGE